MAASPVSFLVQFAADHVYVGLLVLVRLSGLFIIGPVFGTPVVPFNIRVLLAIALTFVMLPVVDQQPEWAFARMDANRDGLVSTGELPEHLQNRFADRVRHARVPEHLAFDEFFPRVEAPRTNGEFLKHVAGELSLGLFLGLAMAIFMSGFELAGQIIDVQTGISLGATYNPAIDSSAGTSGQALLFFATVVLLTMPPLSGHLMIVGALLESFQSLPVGYAFVTHSMVELLHDLIHQSFVLGLQVAAPVLAGMSLISITIGFLGTSVKEINVFTLGFAVRCLVNVTILSLCCSGTARLVVDLVPLMIDHLRRMIAYAFAG